MRGYRVMIDYAIKGENNPKTSRDIFYKMYKNYELYQSL